MNFIKKFMLKILGKQISNKLELEDGTMNDTKVWYKSKAKLSAIIGAVLIAVQQISTALGHPIIIPQWVLEILAAVGVYGIRDAMKS